MANSSGFNFDVSNLDSSFYKKLSVGTPISSPYETIEVGETASNILIQETLNSLNDQFIDDEVKITIKLSGITGSKIDARVQPGYHRFLNPVVVDHPVSDRLVIEGEAPTDHSVLGVSYYDAVDHGKIKIEGEYYTGTTLAAENGFYAQLIVSNGNSLKIGEYLAVYDNRYQKYLNPSFFQFRDTTNGRQFATPYPVTAEKLRASLIIGVHKIVDKIDLDSRTVSDLNVNANPSNKVDYVTVQIKNPNPTYTMGLVEYVATFARRAYLTPQGIVGRYEQGYGSSTVLQDPLFFSGLTSGVSGDSASLPGYRVAVEFGYGATYDLDKEPTTFFTDISNHDNTLYIPVLNNLGINTIIPNRVGLTGMYLDSTNNEEPLGDSWEQYSRLAQTTGLNTSIRNYRDTNDFRAKGFKTIIECTSDGFVIANANKPPELKNILLVSKSGSRGHGVRVENSSSVNLHQVGAIGFLKGAGFFANNKSSINVLADKFSDPEVFREVGAFSCCNYTGFESRNHSNINAPRTVAAGNQFANYYSSENSYINAYASISTCSSKYGIVAVSKSFINGDSSFSCFNGSDGYFCSNGSLLTINSGRACYNYGNGVHAFSSGEIRAFDIIASSNRKDGIVANDMSTIVCGDSAKEPIEWDLYFGYTEPYYNFENPTNISQSKFNGISGLASSTDSFINASFFETYNNSRLGGELGKLKSVNCVYSPTVGYCYGGASAGSTCDSGYRYCDDAAYIENGTNIDDVMDDILVKDTPVASLCIPYADSVGLTGQIPASKSRYQKITGLLSTAYGAESGLTIGKILACKGYLPACLVFGLGFSAGESVPGSFGGSVPTGYNVCKSTNTAAQIVEGATGNAQETFGINQEVLACTADTSSLVLNTICVSSSTAYTTPQRPLNLILPNYDVEIRDSAKIAFAGRIANFGYYDIRTGVRIQPLYRGSVLGSGLIKPATLIGYAGNKNGSELVITDQVALESGVFGNQGAGSLDPRDAKFAVRYSSDDFLSAAELFDPVAQTGFVNNSQYVLNLGNVDPETGALTSSVGVTVSQIIINNTSSTPQQSSGTNDLTSENGYPTY